MPHFFKFALPLILWCAVSGCGRFSSPWMKLAAGERVVFETKLKKHTAQEVSIPSEDALLLSFESDASPALVESYRFARRMPVRLEHTHGLARVSTVKRGGEDLFPSVNGVVPLIMENNTDETLRVRIISIQIVASSK